jgi:hypothetical protein
MNEQETTRPDDWRAEYMGALERAVRAENALRNVRSLAKASMFGSWRFKVANIVDKVLPNG